MNDIIKFLDVHYDAALKLVSDFDITKNKEWDPQIYLNELYVQLGHVYNVLFANENVNENKRKIDNLGDELSDVLLQLINLARVLNIDMYEIKEYKDYKYDDLNGLTILLGQLTEAVMEIYECRFKKNRADFDTSYDFVKDRLYKLFIITYKISKKYKLNMIKEFDDMLKDANGFLDRFRKGSKNKVEFIDIFDKDGNLLGYCEKNNAHKLGYYHKVFGCLIYNNKKNKVFLQLKNPNHNKVNKKPLLEITAGGHLMSGETVRNGVREIKEETGLDVEYEKLTFIEERTCNKTITKDYKIHEFQYYYAVDLKINVEDFKNYDPEEVMGFVELDIHDLLRLLNNKVKRIKGKRENGKIVNVTKDDLDKAYIKNGLYLSLLTKLNIKKGEKVMNNKLKKLYKYTNKQIKKNPNMYYFDDGTVCQNQDYEKDNVKYSVMKVNTDINTNNYLVYLLIISGKKSIPQMLVRSFKTDRGTTTYFNKLCSLVEKNTNQDIISKCYDKLIESNPKPTPLFSRIFNL